jgi:hypothetical protein
VAVQRRGFHVQSFGQRSHRQLVEADFVEQFERRADDQLPI